MESLSKWPFAYVWISSDILYLTSPYAPVYISALPMAAASATLVLSDTKSSEWPKYKYGKRLTADGLQLGLRRFGGIWSHTAEVEVPERCKYLIPRWRHRKHKLKNCCRRTAMSNVQRSIINEMKKKVRVCQQSTHLRAVCSSCEVIRATVLPVSVHEPRCYCQEIMYLTDEHTHWVETHFLWRTVFKNRVIWLG